MRVVPEAAWLWSSPRMMSEVVIVCPTHAVAAGRAEPAHGGDWRPDHLAPSPEIPELF